MTNPEDQQQAEQQRSDDTVTEPTPVLDVATDRPKRLATNPDGSLREDGADD